MRYNNLIYNKLIMYKKLILGVFISMLFITKAAYGQWFLGNFNWAASISYNSTLFHGDLTDRTNSFVYSTPFSKYFYQDRKSGIGFNLEKSIGPYFGVRGNILYTKLISHKNSLNQHFESNLFEYSTVLTLNFTNIFWGVDRYRHVVFYGFIGLGLTESRSWKYDDQTDLLIGTNGFGSPKEPGGGYVPMTETVMPTGLGLKAVVNPNFGFYVEASLHPINTDKLDATISNIAFWEGYGAITLGMDFYFSASRFSSFKRRTPSYRYKGYTSINSRKYKRRSNKKFKFGKKRFRYKRR